MARNDKHSLVLRALAALLAYPDAELRAGLAEIAEAVRDSTLLQGAQKSDVLALIDDIATSDPLDAEGRYVDLFDRGRYTSLNLFQHVHGDGRMRGPAMVDLQQRYRDAGLEPASDELPDYLPAVLEYLSCRDLKDTRDTLESISLILRRLGNILVRRGSRYSAVFAALLQIAREKGLDPSDPVPPAEDFDATWHEQPAFSKPVPPRGMLPEELAAASPSTTNPVR